MSIKWFQTASVISVLVGTWFLAFGLRIRSGIEPKFGKELRIEKRELISPADVRQRPAFFWIGVALITLGGLIELWAIICNLKS